MARVARKANEARGISLGVVARDCPCVSCHYNLKGVRLEGKCPECGAAVSRSIDPANQDATPWVDATQWRPKWWVSFFGPPAPVAAPKATTPGPAPANAG